MTIVGDDGFGEDKPRGSLTCTWTSSSLASGISNRVAIQSSAARFRKLMHLLKQILSMLIDTNVSSRIC